MPTALRYNGSDSGQFILRGSYVEKTVNAKNVELWSGFSETYHDSRPVPPEAIKKIILAWLQTTPKTVVDVGCGTGLSTGIWEDTAENIIGIEPNDDMRKTAEKNVGSERVVFKKGVSNETGLQSGCADVVTVSQAFHWMDIDSTLLEFHRILKPGGVLAIYDFAMPPVMNREIEPAFLELRRKSQEIVYSQEAPPAHNDKDSYLDRIRSFGKFRHARNAACHSFEKWPLPKVIEHFMSTSNAGFAIKIDASIEADINEFIALVRSQADSEFEIVFPYQMVIAVK